MSRRSVPCHFHNKPGGCRRGSQCGFLHDNPSSGPRARPSGPSSRQSPLPNAPGNVCNFYWSTGNCRREFDCKYDHIRNPSSSPSSSNLPRASGSANPLAPFLTEAGLAKLNALSTDIFFAPPKTPLSSNEIHNSLKKYLRDTFRFQKTFDIYGFLVPLASVDTSGPTWAPEDGPLLLTSLATGNGILRIGDILRWPSVSSRAGSSPSELSFQRAYVPLLKFYSSELIIKSTLNHLVNGLYTQFLENFDSWSANLDECMQQIMAAHSFGDPAASGVPEAAMGCQVISSLAVVFFEILARFKNAAATHPNLVISIRNLQTWTGTWIEGVSKSPPTFDDPFRQAGSATRDQITNHLRAKVQRLVAIVDREQNKIDRANQRKPSVLALADRTHEGIVAALSITYEGPGELRPLGVRHDNDHVDIADIRIAPTHGELISRLSPFLPGNFHDAPHHLPAESMERLLDIQFRLLREELTAPLRTSVQQVCDDLSNKSPRTVLSQLIKSKGGKYRGHSDGQDQVLFNVYTNVEFFPLVPDWRGLSVELAIDTPPGKARQSKAGARAEFWKGMSGKRLIQGGLVALVWQEGRRVDVYLGIIASGLTELTESAQKQNGDNRVSIRVVFFDQAVELRILNIIKNRDLAQSGTKVLVEATVMYEAIRPFLESLRTEPESLPFGKYLVHRSREFLSSVNVAPPRYALVPGFTYQLASLFPPGAGIDDLKLNVADATSVASVRAQLRASRLDDSQCEAVVDTLTRELAMIQGPPGTGKSYTGVEILRVLIANRVRPILMIAFTNHALDHMLSSVLDAGITNKVVRLGSRSADEKVSKYSIETIEMVAGKSRLDRSFGHHYRDLKNVQEEIKRLMKTFVHAKVTSDQFRSYLQIQYAEHYEHLYECPPDWVKILRTAFADADSDEDTWMQAGKRGKVEIEDNSMYAYWRHGRDLDFLDVSVHQKAEYEQKLESQNRFGTLDMVEEQWVDFDDPASETASETQSEEHDESSDFEDVQQESWQRDWPSDTDSADELHNFGSATLEATSSSRPIPSIQVADLKDPSVFFGGRIPVIPSSDRPLHDLLIEGTMWSFSRRERERLHNYWSAQIRERLHEDRLQDFHSLRSKYESTLKKHQEGKDEIRRQLLSDIDIVGCTTTGAAKLTSLLKPFPRVMLVEEAGQVLEAHILGSLVPSVEHLILIGDPLQLRPTLNNYALSMDNKRGKEVFKFDMSLMERLAVNGLAMSQINVQRRMRPTISTLIRNALYPALQDHDLVKSYSDIRGFAKNVFFFSHSHRENEGGEESASKYNTFEVDMIKDLVLHLLRQGCYSEEGDIVVLCAYLGQLARVRDALRNEVAVVIDGRDKENLAEQEEELDSDDHAQVERVQVTKRVGELSLIFRTIMHHPVALSRAKEGLFILGNATQLASRSKMWRDVIEQLEDADCVGTAFPIACHNHPDKIEHVSKPGRLALFAPDGGCLQPCNYRLKCGHVCHYKCHPDDPKHVTVSCPQPCRKLCPRNHPCNKECSDECGKCRFPVRDVELPCGHMVGSIECYRLDDLAEVFCTSRVIKNFPTCEHSAEMMCSANPAEVKCTNSCGGIMSCCGRSCGSGCHMCQGINNQTEGRINRIEHVAHPCQKILFCAHTCSKPCSRDHECAKECKEQCRQECAHSRCTSYCSSPCAPCMKECTWICPHQKCPLPCGSVCARLPCDQPCPKSLHCGHRCPSICGEDCTIQTCPICAPADVKEDVVDLFLYRKLEDVDPTAGTLDELLITLPKCRHVFTVETLDGHCGMSDFYTREGTDGKWLQLRSPNSGGETRAPPVCPTCRKAITSPRYGRVFKSADLEVLERNVISKASQNLHKVQTSISGIAKSAIVDALKREAVQLSIPSSSPDKKEQQKLAQKRARARKTALNSSEELPVSLDMLSPSSGELHAVAPAIAGAWKRATHRLSNIYADAMKVAKARSAHLDAWEAAFSCLYEDEMNRSLADPTRAPRKPEEYAMRMARMKVGLPHPRGDKRFIVEALWAGLTARFILGDLATSWMDELIKNAKEFSVDERKKWGSFGLFIFDSCVRDAKLAYSIAEKSESRRQMTTSTLLLLRARLERFKCNVGMTRASGKIQDARPKLLVDVADETRDARGEIITTTRSHTVRLPKDGQTWIPDNFLRDARLIVDEWAKLEKSIRMDTFYEPVSLDEKMAVVRGMNFSHAGHFYQCPQGHVYVITECGGAMERANCPECGAPIGGTGHALDSTNTRAVDLENMVREAGAAPSPWLWAQ
ncbi:hypothetical protein C8R45DRAFT_981206 [Mycena sanguinolenta]|nr:hypothetical protein C8R45DRAFT_981206 [Mycena sanguinolenta]